MVRKLEFCRMRYFLDISYHGGHFHGWQIQKNGNTVQEEIEKAISIQLKSPTQIVGSGRTDTGVHATQQVAHFDIDQQIDIQDFGYKLNALLPPSISINTVRRVKKEANARFDATSRTYHYYIHQKKNPFKNRTSYFFNSNLDIDLMNHGCKIIKGWKNFECFSKVHTEVRHFECHISKAEWTENGEGLLFEVCANRFLRGMVRALVGTLMELGLHKIDLQGLTEVLKSRDRKRAGRSVPAKGLFLTRVTYPKDIYI